MPLYLIGHAVQILLIFHVLKTGRDRYWIWLLIFLPGGIGALVYIVMEILPEFSQGITGQRAVRNIKKAVNPGGDLRTAAQAYERSQNAGTARDYAQALIVSDRLDEAREILQRMMGGLYANDPELLELLATAQFEQKEYRECISTLDQMTEHNPEHNSPHGHLLYARALQAAGDMDDALKAYASVAAYYPGAEARVRWCEAMVANNDLEDAKQELEAIDRDARLAPKYFRRAEKHWLAKARDMQKQISS